jgi:two-component system cell cycle sensor histidine kinase/response regulator CckA
MTGPRLSSPRHSVNTRSARGAAAALTVVENRLRGAIAASLDAFFLCESVQNASRAVVDFTIIELNERAGLFLGRDQHALVGRRISEVFALAQSTPLLPRLIGVVESGTSLEDELQFELLRGIARWVQIQAVPIDGGLAITARDITKRKQVEASLLENEARFRFLVENATDGIYRIDPKGLFTYANPVVSRLLGIGEDLPGIVGRSFLEFVRPDFHDQGIELYRRQVAERIPVTYWEFPAIAIDGRELWIGQNVQIEERNGRVVSMFAVARDITARRRTEMALRESEERHRFLAEYSTDMLTRESPDGAILYASPVCFTLLGYSANELVGQSIFELCHPDDLETARAASKRLMTQLTIETITIRVRRKDGGYIWVETTSQAVKNPKSGGVEAVLSVSRDITERRKLDDELRHVQKMEAIGQLAGGVAHDFNNLLTSIGGFADLLAKSMASDDERRADVAEILKATERAATLTLQLLAFSRRQVLRLELLNVNSVVEDMVKILRRLLGESVTVVTELEPRLSPSRADPAQLEQVLLQLVFNARDAMPEGGELRITTRDVSIGLDEESVLAAGRYVQLEVTDTGIGMAEETRAKVFEPFFTTKSGSERAGLGLATVYGIVAQTGGHITVNSTLNVGTTFTIHLPAADHVPEGKTPAAPSREGPVGNTVLLAEDNEGVRTLTVRLLQSAGYRVLEAADGVEALHVLRSTTEPIDLLITDVMMPEMAGSELASHFAQLQPGTPIMFITGFMDEDTLRTTFEHSGATVLLKPFSAEALIGRVRSLIGAAQGAGVG